MCLKFAKSLLFFLFIIFLSKFPKFTFFAMFSRILFVWTVLFIANRQVDAQQQRSKLTFFSIYIRSLFYRTDLESLFNKFTFQLLNQKWFSVHWIRNVDQSFSVRIKRNSDLIQGNWSTAVGDIVYPWSAVIRLSVLELIVNCRSTIESRTSHLDRKAT